MESSGFLTAVFLQARIGSKRLPAKALLPLAGKTVLEQVMISLGGIKAGLHVLLTDKESEKIFRPLAEVCGFQLFTGHSSDVLLRYSNAAKCLKPDIIIRATGDNPLVSDELAVELLKHHVEGKADFSAYTGLPLGVGVEILGVKALLEANKRAADPYEREHVSPFLYRRKNEFNVFYPEPGKRYCLPGARVTLDTEADYKYITGIYNELYKDRPIRIEELILWLKEKAE